jgi:hypothetical protein
MDDALPHFGPMCYARFGHVEQNPKWVQVVSKFVPAQDTSWMGKRPMKGNNFLLASNSLVNHCGYLAVFKTT